MFTKNVITKNVYKAKNYFSTDVEKGAQKLLAMATSGSQSVTGSANTSGNGTMFPGLFLMEGPCKMRVTTYAFYTYAKSVKQYEEIFKQLNSNKWEEECGYRFVMCRAEVDESGQVKALGMIQFWKEPFVIDEIVVYKNVLKRLLDASSGIPFFREIEDQHVNDIHVWLHHSGRGKIFKHGMFTGYWDWDRPITSSDEEEEDEAVANLNLDHLFYLY